MRKAFQPLLIAAFCAFASVAHAAEVTAVTTAAPGSFTTGNVPCATGPHAVDECSLSGTLISGAAQKANNGSDFASAAAARANLNSIHATVTSGATLDTTARLWPCDATAGAVTLTVPAGSGVPNYIWDVKKVDTSVNACTLTMSGSDTLDGNATVPIRFQNDDLTIQNKSGSTTWYIR